MNTIDRLITLFTPEHYELSLTLNRIERRFHGMVTINGSLASGAAAIKLHAKDLDITSAVIDGKHASWSIQDDELYLTLDTLIEGEHTVTITFEGIITDPMHGLYPCYYSHDGVNKELLATQFESHHAREVFPCIDEPEAKATFDVTLTTEEGVTALSNMPIKQQDHHEGRLVTSFDRTPRMSTYLLAWVVGELHKKTAHTTSGTEVSVWATPAQPAESLDFALDIACRTIDFFNDYFDTPYPLPKSDHVALPDFSSGAMENWGLITYREIALLADPTTTSISSKQYVATVVAHELAHQWFGNLVTMRWWNNLWLNESFANMMEYVAINALHPEWNVWLEQASNENVIALRRDAIDGVQSVQTDVSHPDEISTLFDGAIVYAKGGRLLRMLQQYVGEDAFRKGLSHYFKQFAYDNTEGDDLWRAIADASGKDIVRLMNTWISQPGYPVVHIEQHDQTVTLQQNQFFVGAHEPSEKTWPIPLFSTCSEMPELLDEKKVLVERHHDSLLLFNNEALAHYLPHYDEVLRGNILRSITEGTLSEINRLSFLNDAILLARGGILESVDLLPILDAYKNETSEPVWGLMAMTLSEMRKFVENDADAELALKKLSYNLAKKQYERLGWEHSDGESDEDSKLRALVISLVLYSDNDEAIKKAKHLYDTHTIENLDPELRSVILSSVIRHDQSGGETDVLYEQYVKTTHADISQDLCAALTSSRSLDKIKEMLEKTKDSRLVRPQDVGYWFVYFIRSRHARDETWLWLQRNWDWVEETFAGDKSYDTFPRYAASGLVTPQQRDEYKTFFMPKRSITALTRVIDLGVSEIDARVTLIAKDGPAVANYLKHQ